MMVNYGIATVEEFMFCIWPKVRTERFPFVKGEEAMFNAWSMSGNGNEMVYPLNKIQLKILVIKLSIAKFWWVQNNNLNNYVNFKALHWTYSRLRSRPVASLYSSSITIFSLQNE